MMRIELLKILFLFIKINKINEQAKFKIELHTVAGFLQSIVDYQLSRSSSDVNIIFVVFGIEKIELCVVLDNKCDERYGILIQKKK